MNHFKQAVYHALMAVRAIPPPRPTTWESFFGESSTLAAGVSIDESNALNYSPVYSGVATLSRDVAKLPLVLYRNLPNGGKEPFKTHPLYRILHDDPNPEMTSFKFRETMQALCLLWGNAYAEIVRNDLDMPVGLYPIAPSRVSILRGESSGRLFYRVANPGSGTTDVQYRNMVHLSSLSTDGIIGHGIVGHARESIGLGVATERFGAKFFGNGSTFGGIVEYPGLLNEQAKNNTRQLLEAVHAGIERAHKILMIGGGSKFVKTGTAPNEAQFLETRKFQIAEVARWLSMPNHKLGDLENAHFTNIEEQELQSYVGTVSGWLEMWEQELSRKLIRPLEYAQQTIEHNLEGVLRGDSAKRAEFYSKMHAIGAFSINDILRKENMNPIGPEGDVHLVPLNMIPAERYGEWIDVTIKEKEVKAQPPQPRIEAPAEPERNEAARFEELKTEIRTLMAASEERATLAIEAEQAETRAAAAEQAKQEADALAAASAQQVMDAETKLAEATAKAEAEAARAEASDQEREAAIQAAKTAAQVLAEKEVALEQAERDASAATQQAAAAAAKVADLEARAIAVTAQIEAAEADKALFKQQLDETQVRRQEQEQAYERALQDLHAVQAAADAFKGELQSRKESELDRLTRVVAAHRVGLVDVVQRMLKPELHRARTKQSTPESLRKWADAFYQTHRDVCAEALYPAVLIHLEWKRSDENARDVAKALADAHCEESETQIRQLIVRSEPEEFHANLEQMLLRWEAERPMVLADKILQDEITYIRSLS